MRNFESFFLFKRPFSITRSNLSAVYPVVLIVANNNVRAVDIFPKLKKIPLTVIEKRVNTENDSTNIAELNQKK